MNIRILGHPLGSKDVSRQVASRAAAQTGLSADVLKRMLPLAATLMMGIASMLTPLLDGNRDGSIVDDVTSMIGGFMKRS